MASYSVHIKSYNLWQLKRSVTEKKREFYETKSFFFARENQKVYNKIENL